MTNFKSLSNSEIFCNFLHFKLRDILSTLLLVLDPYCVFLSLFLRTSHANLEYFPQRQWKDVDLFAMSYSRVHTGILKSGEFCCKGVSTTWFLWLMSVHRRGQVPVALGSVSCLWKPSKMLSICLGHELPLALGCPHTGPSFTLPSSSPRFGLFFAAPTLSQGPLLNTWSQICYLSNTYLFINLIF